MEPGRITQAIPGCEAGDASAQDELVEALGPFLHEMVRLVRHQLDVPLKARIDSVGVVNEALNSLLTGIAKREFPALRNRADVRRTLAALVRRTLVDHVRHHRRRKRSVRREAGSATHAGAPAPAVAADMAEWLNEFLDSVRPVHEKAMEVVKLSLAGLDNSEIARELALSVRYVQVLKKTMYEQWRARAEPEGGNGPSA